MPVTLRFPSTSSSPARQNDAKTNSIFAFDVLEKLIDNKGAKLAIHKVRSIIDQQYVGDINIIPKKQLRNLAQVLANPTVDSIRTLIESGERAAWPQLHVIDRNTQISETLRYYLRLLKQREAQELGHVDAPLATGTSA